jgi:hypothetical protein
MTAVRNSNCTLLNLNESVETQVSVLGTMLDLPISTSLETAVDKMVAAFTFLKCFENLHQPLELRPALQEGVKGKQLSDSLTHHRPLEKWRHPCVRLSENLHIWLDPIQVRIMDSKHPLQVIVGPASTGKTILIQLKIIEKLKNNENVVVILPSATLVSKYQSALKNFNQKKLRIITPDQCRSNHELAKAHVFIDEFCASALDHKDFEDEVKRISNNLIKFMIEAQSYSKLLWITMDFKQGLESKWEFPSSTGVFFLESKYFVKTHLMMFHRCTANALKNYRNFCGPLTDIGHQHQGEPTKDVITKPQSGNNSITAWAEEIKKTFFEETKKGYKEEDVAIIIAVDNADCALLFLELKSIMGQSQIHFEADTLSQEWPVVILCLNDKSSKEFRYVAFSRVIHKVVNVFKPEGGGSETGDDRFRQFTLSLLSINKCNCNIFRSISVEVVGFHQLAWTKSELHIVRHLKIDLDCSIKKLNYWISRLIAGNKDQLEVFSFY